MSRDLKRSTMLLRALEFPLHRRGKQLMTFRLAILAALALGAATGAVQAQYIGPATPFWLPPTPQVAPGVLGATAATNADIAKRQQCQTVPSGRGGSREVCPAQPDSPVKGR